MTFKPAIWFPIAVAASAINLVAVAIAVAPAEPWHATAHAGLSLAFGLWAQRLRRGRGGGELQTGLEELDAEVSRLRQELGEAQERLDFTERVLAQHQEVRRVEPQR